MPQFDFFIWFSLSLGTIITFQFLYYFILYYILAPFADLQKTLIKLYVLKQAQQNLGAISLFEQLFKIYFQNTKLKSQSNLLGTVQTNVKKKTASKLNTIKFSSKKITNTLIHLKTKKNISITKKDKFLKTFTNALAISRFLVSTLKQEPILQNTIPNTPVNNLPIKEKDTPLKKGNAKKGKKKS